MNRADKLRAFHKRCPEEDSWEVLIPRKVCRLFTAHDKVYMTVYEKLDPRKENNHWFVLLTDHKNGRTTGQTAYAVDFRMDNGELYRRSDLGVWKSALTMWPVKRMDEQHWIFEFVAKVIDLAFEQHSTQ